MEAGKVALLECRVTHLSPHHTVSWLRFFSSSVSALLILSLTHQLQQERRCLRADCGRSRLQLGPPFARCHQVQVGSLSTTDDHHQFSKKNAEIVNKKGHKRFRRLMGANAQINRAINPGVRRKVCQLHSIRNRLLPHIDSSSHMEISQYLWPRNFDVFCQKSTEFSFPLLKA